MTKGYPWIILDLKTSRFRCERCGESMAAPDMPMKIDSYVGVANGFIKGHKKCKEKTKGNLYQ